MSTDRERARADEKRYRQSARGKAMRREQRRRWRARHPEKVQARVRLLVAHGERLRQEERLRDHKAPTLPPTLADTRRQEILRLSAAIRKAEDNRDEKEADRLRKEFNALIGPAKRRAGLGVGITGLDLGLSHNDDPSVLPYYLDPS